MASERPVVGLRPMTVADFEGWRDIAIRHHAEQTSRATGRSLEVSLGEAAQLLPKVLVDGLDTKGMSLFVVVNGSDQAVGWLWVGSAPDDPDAGFVFDIIIREAFRNRGYGRAAMSAGERFFMEQGKVRVGLQVATRNAAARHLYESMGYSTVMTTMAKPLTPRLTVRAPTLTLTDPDGA
jgi:ribosomal protein S18 acetylase RimI-like enzyme